MKKYKAIGFTVSLLILFVIYIINTYDGFDFFIESFQDQSFDEIALKYYDDTDFDYMSMEIKDDKRARASDQKIIQETINYFNTLEYKRISSGKWYSLSGDMQRIYLSTEDSGNLGIEIYNEEYVRIDLGYIIEEKNKDVTKIYPNLEYNVYKVLDEKIDIGFIESIYESMEIEDIN